MKLRLGTIIRTYCRREAASLVALILFFLIYFWDFIFGAKTFAYGDDNTYLLSPVFAKVSALISRGELPTHIDTSVGGLELYNSAQFSIYYPLYPFYFGTVTSGLAAAESLNFFTLLHILLGSVTCYILARTLRSGPWGALFAGLTFCAANNTRIYASWINITSPYAWAPLLLCGLVQLHRQRFRLGYVLTTISFAFIILASPSQPMIHSLFLMGCATLYWLAVFFVKRDRAPLVSLFFLCLTCGTVFLLCAPVLLPTGLEMKNMIRWLGPFGSVVGNTRLPFKAFLIDEAPLAEWVRIFLHGPSASLVGSSFIGIVPGALALLSALWFRKNPCILGLLLLAMFGLLSSFGTHLGLAYINYQLPLINKIREPSRHLVLFVFAVSALAAIGVSFLERLLPKWLFGFMVTLGLIGHFVQMRGTLQTYPNISEIDLTSDANRDAQRALVTIHATRENSFIKVVDTEPPAMFFGMNSFYLDGSFKTVDGYYNPQRYSNHRRIMSLTPEHEELMRLSGVTHIICGECPKNLDYTNSYKIGSYTTIQLNSVTYPTLYPGVSEKNNPFILTTADGESMATAVDGVTPLKLLSWPRSSQSIRTDIDGANYKRFTVDVRDLPSLFVADNLFSSNWKYYVNGGTVASYPVNFMRQGIILGAGEHIVEMRYSPRYLSAFFAMSSLGAVIFFVVLIFKKTSRDL